MSKINELVLEAMQKEDESEYHKYFREKMKEYGIESPDELSEEEKEKFFDDVDKNWPNAEEDRKY